MFVRILIVVLAAALAIAVIARGSSGAGHESAYVVQPADTLWSIAAEHYGGDVRAAVWKLERRNGLAGAVIVPGQRLVLP
jgi:LysM repeat protein